MLGRCIGRMSYRGVSVIEIREILRLWLEGRGYREVARLSGTDRKTVRRYVDRARACGLDRDGGACQLTDELLAAVIAEVRPSRPNGKSQAWEIIAEHHEQIAAWLTQGLTLTKVHTLLGRRGVMVSYRTLHRYATTELGFGRRRTTVRVADCEPGAEVQVDFGRLGLLTDAADGRRRVVHGLIFTAVYSRHLFVYPTYRQTLNDVIAGFEAAWRFFGGYAGVNSAIRAQIRRGENRRNPRRGAPMLWIPCLVRSTGPDGEVRASLGDPLVDDYLEFVAARSRPNTLLAVAFDLKVFFSVVGKDPARVTTADVFEFLRAAVRGGASGWCGWRTASRGCRRGRSPAGCRRCRACIAYLLARGDTRCGSTRCRAAWLRGARAARGGRGRAAGAGAADAAAGLVAGRGRRAGGRAAHAPGPGDGAGDAAGRAAPLRGAGVAAGDVQVGGPAAVRGRGQGRPSPGGPGREPVLRRARRLPGCTSGPRTRAHGPGVRGAEGAAARAAAVGGGAG